MNNAKYIACAVVLIALVITCTSQESDEWDSNTNEKRMSRSDASKFLDAMKRVFGGKDEELREDNDELGERRSEAFEAYEEKCEPMFHLGKRACVPMDQCGPNFKSNAFNNFDPKHTTTTKKPSSG